MKVIPHTNEASLPPLAATIGFFDGVHLGHRFLIDQIKEIAVKKGLHSALVTFPSHPRKILQTDFCPQLLSSPTEKMDLLEATGVEYVILLPFTYELSMLSAKAFMQLLRDRFHIRTLVIGYDHRFGHNRLENVEDYCRYGEELALDIVRVPAYTNGENKISSSTIRRLLKEGDVARAARVLGYNYCLGGTVIDGCKVGRTLGFPTANLQINCPDKLLPAEGVYAVYVYVEGKKWQGILNIGRRPTFTDETEVRIEVHILHFSGDLYRQNMRLEFVERLRAEEKYDTVDALVAQMHKDRETAARILT